MSNQPPTPPHNQPSHNQTNPPLKQPEIPVTPILSTDQTNLNSFFKFHLTENKLSSLQKSSSLKLRRFVLTGLIFGFFTEYILGNTKVFSNIVKKSTIKRLTAKKKEDQKIGQKIKKKLLLTNSSGQSNNQSSIL